MAENAFVGASDNVSVSPGSAVTYYGNFGFSAAATALAETTEANVSLVHRGANCSLKGLRVSVTTNGRAATSSVTTRKNGSDTSQVASITASTTGIFTDLTNAVALTDGDLGGYKLSIGSTSGAFLLASITANLESSGQAFNHWSAAGSASTATASATRYWPVVGQINAAFTTEVNGQSYAPAAGAGSGLRVYVTAARATATTAKSRINAADGAQTVSITGTGAFEDTSHSDSFSVGSLIDVATVTGSGSDTLTITSIAMKFTPSTASESALAAGPNQSTTLTSGQTRYYNPIGKLTTQATEAVNQSPAPFSGLASNLAAVVSANASTTAATIVLRKAGVDTALTFSIAGAATGGFADTTHSVSSNTGDLLSIKGSGSDGTVTFRMMGLKYTAQATAWSVTAAQGAFTLTGQAAGLKHNYPLQAGHGSFALTASDAALAWGRRMTAAHGSFALTGQAADLLKEGSDRTLVATGAAYALTGQSAGLNYSGSPSWIPRIIFI
ncbi:MAG: hypothetical protein KA105_02875 [Caulobacter sp.]|nr:hypothetical protein [Caulobacter sp.]